MPISTPTLEVADNADGSGGVATISNGDAGATHEVFVQAVNGELGGSTWTSRGSRVGNGTINIAAGVGYYWAKVEASSGGESVTSNLAYVQFSEAGEAVLSRCLAAVQAKIAGLSLPGIDGDRIVVRKVPDDRNLSKPAIVIAPFQRESLAPVEGTNARDDVGYPILVAAMDGDNQHPTSNHNRNLLWRERIRRAFHNQRLAGVDEIINTTVEPLPITDATAWFERNTFVTTLLVRCISRELRGA